jgi:predicted ester cyclase
MTAQIVAAFINDVWNNGATPDLHPSFVDHSLPPALGDNAASLATWVAQTSMAFEHRTLIEDQVTEGDKSVVRITMRMKHIGTWRDIPATGKEVQTRGYRLFRIADGKIIEHWALIDGNALETQLRR